MISHYRSTPHQSQQTRATNLLVKLTCYFGQLSFCFELTRNEKAGLEERDAKDSNRKRSRKVISFCLLANSWFVFYSDTKNAEKGPGCEKFKEHTFRWKDQWSVHCQFGECPGFKAGIFASHPSHPLLCISTQNGSLMHCCETFTLSGAFFLLLQGNAHHRLNSAVFTQYLKARLTLRFTYRSWIGGLVPVDLLLLVGKFCPFEPSDPPNLVCSMRCRVVYGDELPEAIDQD